MSIHAVDISTGRPAAGLLVRLSRVEADGETVLAEGTCGNTGLFDHPTVRGEGITAGTYVAEFDVGQYFAGSALAVPTFLDVVRFHFGIADADEHYHLPFKFTAWGYSLFRGGQ